MQPGDGDEEEGGEGAEVVLCILLGGEGLLLSHSGGRAVTRVGRVSWVEQGERVEPKREREERRQRESERASRAESANESAVRVEYSV